MNRTAGIAAAIAIFSIFGGAATFAGGRTETAAPISVTVGSKIDTEGALLGNMIALVLEKNGFKVVDRIQTGATSVVRSAIIAGEIDIYPEYTGNGFYLFSGKTEESIWKNAATAWKTVKELDYQANRIVWLDPAPADNTWAIAVRGDLARKEGLKTLEDLAAYINRGGAFKIAGSEEFVSSAAALPSFESGYGFKLGKEQLLVFSSGNTAITEQAAASGTEGVNAAMAYGTDGQIAALGLVVLADTKGVQPVYQPAPIVREEKLQAAPKIADLLRPVFASLDLTTLQRLNARIAVEGADPRSVAKEYLSSKGWY